MILSQRQIRRRFAERFVLLASMAFAICVACCPQAVSYTHLDVYKRQAQTYGPRLIQLGLALLNGQRVPPYSYVDHKLVTAASVRASLRE